MDPIVEYQRALLRGDITAAVALLESHQELSDELAEAASRRYELIYEAPSRNFVNVSPAEV